MSEEELRKREEECSRCRYYTYHQRRRARKELEKAGLLKMCKVRVLSKETGKFLWNSKGYRVFGETELRYSVTE